jgi:glycosyltransferase involved in cell wall biosynthesis
MGSAAPSVSMDERVIKVAMDKGDLSLESKESSLPQCSVVVATRNRSSNLRRLLEGLVQQAAPPAFEVVVADNGSLDDTPAVIDSFRSELALRSVRVPEPGKGRALNAALALAQGEIIVFTDDDVVPEPGLAIRDTVVRPTTFRCTTCLAGASKSI